MRKAVYEEWVGRRPIKLARLADALHKLGIGCSTEGGQHVFLPTTYGESHIGQAGAIVEAYLASDDPDR